MIGMPIERNLSASWNALGAVDVMEEMPMISAAFNASQSGSEISSINTLDVYPLFSRIVASRIVPSLGSGLLP